jgi:hypothetical protein
MNKSLKRKKNSVFMAPFIEKLTTILDNDSYTNVVSWTSDGSAFNIRSVSQFTE